ncbi:hypothetical protein VOLCADRAFT_86160 [Volvox carteri f. nagariensis]|uniref:Uncharacterized protein n=1 Tax=Volvox carteri f. nagariensis TaxID=3068 RepID=D8TI13_VOLCA|nr:uncharacterized protein VOLCADRAFT_86160 [Volvox carteri f. nagariensis]EFJ52811.1 hypothetical protein VOLCADRAFT_86160 [Volvox carteri f. nagariensis]|eukprot:XP_002945816.1 hypothetical protein VOLCADRAFT_86160 [Volvox carteri f. nagariensis]
MSPRLELGGLQHRPNLDNKALSHKIGYSNAVMLEFAHVGKTFGDPSTSHDSARQQSSDKPRYFARSLIADRFEFSSDFFFTISASSREGRKRNWPMAGLRDFRDDWTT